MACSGTFQDGSALDDDPDCLLRDIMFGIILDWSCKSAGVTSPWYGQELCLPLSLLPDFTHFGQIRGIPGHRIYERWFEMVEKRLQLAERKVLLKAVKSASGLCYPSTVDSSLPNALTSWHCTQNPPTIATQPSNPPAADLSPLSPRKRPRPLSLHDHLQRRSIASVGSQDYRKDRPINSGNSGSTHVASDPRPQKRFFQPSIPPDISPHPLHLPLTQRSSEASTLFLSQLIPQSFNLTKREKALSILLKSTTPRLPRCVICQPHQSPLMFFGSLTSTLPQTSLHPSDADYLAGSPKEESDVEMAEAATLEPTFVNSFNEGWSGGNFPVELFSNITMYLSREDIQNMRLVSRQFERNISSSLFKVVVVPFRPEIYGLMIGSYQTHRALDLKGKGKAISNSTEGFSSDIEDAPFGLYSSQSRASDVDHGMRVFKGWGSHIHKFALSFEVDEEILTRPPKKGTQQTHETFWGEFPWPYERYNRFELTEGLENTADKTHCMTAALSHLSNVSELGLSLDSGLGWLAGPDKSDRAKIFKDKSKVFGTRYPVPSTSHIRRLWIWEMISGKDRSVTRELLNTYSIDLAKIAMYSELLTECEILLDEPLRVIAEYMHDHPVGRLRIHRLVDLAAYVWKFLVQKGIVNSNDAFRSYPRIKPLVLRARRLVNVPKYEDEWRRLGNGPVWRAECQRRRVLLNGETSRLSNISRSVISSKDETDLSNAQINRLFNHVTCITETLPTQNRGMARLQQDDIIRAAFGNLEQLGINIDDILGSIEDSEVMSDDPAPPIIFEGVEINEGKSLEKELTVALLRPKNLTTAQKEWLLETEWAQRAFLSSYVLAVMDNQATFAHVSTLTIAKISSRYLTMLDRPDFWDSLPNVTNLTIMVSPDWRGVNKKHEGWVEIYDLPPSLAVNQFALVLEKHIALQRSLKTLHLGYIGGGEHATGLFARNQNILPAPIMVNMGRSNVLMFPHIKDLTFTNCWFASTVLVAFASQMMKQQLQKLSLASVSLVIYGGASSLDTMRATPVATRRQTRRFKIPVGIGYGVIPSEVARRPRQGAGPPNHAFHNNMALAAMAVANPGIPNPPTVQVDQNQTSAAASDWLKAAPEASTWAEVIDAITPGITIAQQRFTHGLEDEKPDHPANPLLQLVFDSCGYVRLPFQELDLNMLGAQTMIPDLIVRKKCLEPHMMHTDDEFLGNIVPASEQKDEDILVNAFGLSLGWEEDPKKHLNREDGQPLGGTGRFSGVIKRKTSMDEGSSPWEMIKARSPWV